MYRHFLFAAGLLAASTAQPQTTGRTPWEYIEGGVASAISRSGEAAAVPSSFQAEFRTHVVTSASGEAEFGVVGTADGSPAAFVLSLGVASRQGAILFTRTTGTPLEVGRYRVSEHANDADEILALVMTGAPDRPTGVYRGHSGWLVVTAASGSHLAGRFEVDGVGFLAEEPSRDDRSMSATGSFSAGLGSAALRKFEDDE